MPRPVDTGVEPETGGKRRPERRGRRRVACRDRGGLDGRPGIGRVRPAEIPDELDVRDVVHDEHGLVAQLGRAGRVERVAGLEAAGQARGVAAEHDQRLGRPVVEPDARRPRSPPRGRRRGPVRPGGRRGRGGRCPSPDPRRPRRWSSPRRAPAIRRRSPAPAVAPAPGELDAPAAGTALPSTMSARWRGTIANRRSVAVGYGRFTMPVTVAARPTARSVEAIPLPARPAIGTRPPWIWSSAVHRSPLLWTSTIVPATLTSRHSTAAVGADFSPWTAGWREPRTRVSSARRRGAPQASPDRARHPHSRPEPHRGVRGGEVDLDRGGAVLEDRPAAAGVEQARADREHALDRDPLAGVHERGAHGHERGLRGAGARLRRRAAAGRRRGRRRGLGGDHDVATIPQPQPVAVERALARRPLPDDAGQADPRPPSGTGRHRARPMRRRGSGASRRPTR